MKKDKPTSLSNRKLRRDFNLTYKYLCGEEISDKKELFSLARKDYESYKFGLESISN